MGSYQPDHPDGAPELFRRSPEGEILPPDYGTGPQVAPPYQQQYVPPPPPPTRRRRPGWAQAPATYLLVGINCAVYLAMVVRGVSPGAPTLDQLMDWGANNAGSVLLDGQWVRIVTAMFVHVGILHIAMNMWCLWNLSLLAEPLMGSVGVIAVYVLTGAAGNLLSTGYNWWQFSPDWMRYHAALVSHQAGVTAMDPSVFFPAGAGASGAVFGIAGALIVLLKSKRLPVPLQELKRLRKSVIYFAAINLGIGLVISLNVVAKHTGVAIDNSAHLGGVLCGLLVAAPMVPRLGSPKLQFTRRLRLAVVSVTGLLVLFGFYLVQLPR